MPSLSEALDNVNVVNNLTTAWNNTQQNQVEWGGWIYFMPESQTYSARLKTSGQQTAILLTTPSDLSWFSTRNYTIISDFHCHPGTSNSVAAGQPSAADIAGAKALSYNRLVFTPDTDHRYPDDLYRKADARPTPTGFPNGAIMWQIR